MKYGSAEVTKCNLRKWKWGKACGSDVKCVEVVTAAVLLKYAFLIY